jgi:multicomponent K+:H+ antiporter subunit G
MSAAPAWVEIAVALLLGSSGVFVLISAIGVVSLPDFFLRLHPSALAYTFGVWCVALASVLYFSVLESRAAIHLWLIPILLSMTVPVTTVLLARVALFRRRSAGGNDAPPPLSPAGKG